MMMPQALYPGNGIGNMNQEKKKEEDTLALMIAQEIQIRTYYQMV